MARGKFIALEGGDGAGKDTQIEFLKKEFPDAVFTREPGGTPLGQSLRNILLHEAAGNVALKTELLLFLADRAQHVAEVIEPALVSGKTVFTNRSWISLIAYQLYGRDQHEFRALVDSTIANIYETCPLDLVVILDISPEEGLRRIKATGKTFDTMERLPLAAHERIRQGFLEVAKGMPQAVVIDAARPPEEVWKDARAAVGKVL